MFVPGKIISTFTTKNDKQIIIRYPKPEDVDGLLDYINALSKEDTFIQYSGEVITIDEERVYLEKVLDQCGKDNSRYLYAECNDEIIGTCEVSRQGKRREHVGRIGIAVKNEYRDQGLGSKLLALILEEAKALGLKLVDLGVYSLNERAIHLYKQFGFIEIGRGPGFTRWKNGFIDELWMYKKL